MTQKHQLTNGRYLVGVSSAGAGYSRLGDIELTRWSGDDTRDAEGFFAYLRDVETGRFWSAGVQPAPQRPGWYRVSLAPGLVRIVRHDEGIEIRTEISVGETGNVEQRSYTIHNMGKVERQLELTTCIEVVLNVAGADAGHPAFSKLFVQTESLPGGAGLLARRRQRSPEDPTLYLGHALVDPASVTTGSLECETDRARFIGRGHSLADPVAMSSMAPLSGTTGNVLDPLFAMRRRFTIPAGATIQLVGILAAGNTREEVETLLRDAAGRPADFSGAVTEGIIDSLEMLARERPPSILPAAAVAAVAPADEALRFYNGVGGFSADGSEYVVRIDRTEAGLRLPPLPWTNVVANPDAGFVASETGLGFTWVGNSRENRLTPWFNDPVTDPVGEALYLVDRTRGTYWSPTPAPVPGSGPYETRHGFGYSTWRHTSSDLVQEVVAFVATKDPVKIVRLRVTNTGTERRSLALAWYGEWVLGGVRSATAATTVTESASSGRVLLARNSGSRDVASSVAFAAINGESSTPVEFTGDRATFLGRYGSAAAPEAIRKDAPLDGRTGASLDPCAAFRITADVEPGATLEWSILLGQTPSREAALGIVARFDTPDAVAAELDAVQAGWRERLGAVQIETPVPAIDLMVNGWLAYQNLSCRIWARSAMYQSGGAFGYRDQLQDAASMVYHSPDLTREQILLHAANQFVEGDVMHWWHPPAGRGIRTRFADDLLWLPLLAQYYVDTTGDRSVYDESARFLTARALHEGEDEAFLEPTDSGTAASVYEHCCRALDRSLAAGVHNLPFIGTGDWNDGMNRVGRLGRGESVWMGFFLYAILERFIPTVVARGEAERAERYRARMRTLHAALNEGGWDGGWYRRAYYDDGAPLGSASSDECQIDAIAQAWSVLAGVASPERAAIALDAMESRLVDEEAGIIRLLTPPFDKTPHDPGYIKGYLPGVRENGGQYTHAALWAVRALAEAGRRDRAVHLFEMLSPVTRGGSPAAIATYQVEPYVVAADVYGEAPHTGRGGWTWYTGSAGWMFRVAFESLLGITTVAGRTLVLRPCIPAEWPGFTVRYRLPGDATRYRIVVRQTNAASAVRSATAAARVVDGAITIDLVRDGGEHLVEVDLGDDVGTSYRPSASP
ncbi:MAG: glycosyl transferase [Gemmatimonadales bacterium]